MTSPTFQGGYDSERVANKKTASGSAPDAVIGFGNQSVRRKSLSDIRLLGGGAVAAGDRRVGDVVLA